MGMSCRSTNPARATVLVGHTQRQLQHESSFVLVRRAEAIAMQTEQRVRKAHDMALPLEIVSRPLPRHESYHDDLHLDNEYDTITIRRAPRRVTFNTMIRLEKQREEFKQH